MEKSKNKRANNMLWYVIGLCVLLIAITSVFMSANRKDEANKPIESASESESDVAKETIKEDAPTIVAPKNNEVKETEEQKTDEKKPALPEESELNSALVNKLIQLSPEEQEKVDAFVQGLIASR